MMLAKKTEELSLPLFILYLIFLLILSKKKTSNKNMQYIFRQKIKNNESSL